MILRKSLETEKESIRSLHLSAFGKEEGEPVSKLVVELLEDKTAQPLLSLVVEQDDQLVGHVLFTTVKVEGSEVQNGYILCPLAVAPDFQRSGLGKNLITQGLEMLKEQGAEFVLVLGDPAYYTRFGFHTDHQLKPPYELPYPEAWMVQGLKSGVLDRVHGTVQCADALSPREYW